MGKRDLVIYLTEQNVHQEQILRSNFTFSNGTGSWNNDMIRSKVISKRILRSDAKSYDGQVTSSARELDISKIRKNRFHTVLNF